MRTHAVDIFLAMTCCQLGVVSASITSDNIEAEAYRLSIESYRQAVKIEQRILETASRLAGRGEGKSYDEEKQIVREGCELVDDIAAQESDPEVVYLVAKGLYDEKVRDSIDGQILFHARERFAVRLGELGTREAYKIFLHLKRQYGIDGRERLKFDYWEKQLFGKYVDEKSTAYRQADKIEQRVVKTASRLAGRGEGKSYDEEKQIVREGCELVDDIAAQESDPEVVYLVAERLYDEAIVRDAIDERILDVVRESIDEQILFHARECFAVRLGKLGTREAYEFFLRLKRQYGRDAGESLKFDYWEKQLFGKYMDKK